MNLTGQTARQTIEGENWHDVRRKVAMWQGGRCCYCMCLLKSSGVTMEHIVPVSKGGRDQKHNLAASCPECNFERGTEPHESFRYRKMQQIIEMIGKGHDASRKEKAAK